MRDLISIIIPVYQAEKYLEQCVTSLLNQTYPHLEILLVNDGSPDQSGELCEAIATRDTRVKVFHKKNGGPASAQNAGIDIAKGKYLAFLDCDDWVHEEYIQRLYQLLVATQSDIAACNFLKVYPDKKEDRLPSVEIYEYTNIEALAQLVGPYDAQFAVAWGKIYARDLFEEIRYPLKNHEDEFAIHHLLLKAEKIVFTTEQLYYYLQREGSIMQQDFNPQMNLDKIEAFSERITLFERYGLIEGVDYMQADIFHMYRQIQAKSLNEEQKLSEHALNQLKHILRAGDYPLKFKLFYELYYLMPSVMNKVYQVIKKER